MPQPSIKLIVSETASTAVSLATCSCAVFSLAAITLIGCSISTKGPSHLEEGPFSRPSFSLTDRGPEPSLRFVVYGDMRFTGLSETRASLAGPRQALVAQIGKEKPDAVFLTGDVPWHGGDPADYEVFARETAVWRSEQVRIYPVLGNHEFKGCREADCLERWWGAFPELRGRRWYSVALGGQVQLLALDSESSFLVGSQQGKWLKAQLHDLPAKVQFVLFLLHRPPVTDAPDGVRSNEAALAQELATAAVDSRARFVVCAAHVHNYERFQRDNIVFLVSGGGGGKPEAVKRSAADLYEGDNFPNFHFVSFQLLGEQLQAKMVRLESNATSDEAATWSVRDNFVLNAKAP